MSNLNTPPKRFTRYDIIDKDGKVLASTPIAVESDNVFVTVPQGDINWNGETLSSILVGLKNADEKLQDNIDNIKVISQQSIDSLFK